MTTGPALSALAQIDLALHRAALATNWIASVTPLNVADERQRFLGAVREGRRYEPQFEYDTPELRDAILVVDELRRLDFGSVPVTLRDEYEAARDLARLELELIQALASADDERVSRVSRNIYWPGDAGPLVDAARLALGPPLVPIQFREDNSPPVTPRAVADAIRDAVSASELGWQTTVDRSSTARVRVSEHTREIFVSQDARFTEADIRKLIVHEIETHVMRAENGRRLWRFRLFEIGTAGSEMVEEGMALLNEQTVGVSRPHQLRLIALHVIGIDLASRSSFFDTFQAVAPYFEVDAREAFDRVLRWKRGLRRQDRPNALWKDVVYFGGVQRVSDYFRRGGDMRALYFGRYDDRRMPADIALLLDEFGRGPEVHPLMPRFLSGTDEI
jgi:hypothetical protein